LQDTDVAGALTRFAAQKGVTLVLVGRTHRSWWKRLRQGTVVERLLKASPGLDVLVVAPDDGGES
jgi:two-component system sensor histidine kinase KdpD